MGAIGESGGQCEGQERESLGLQGRSLGLGDKPQGGQDYSAFSYPYSFGWKRNNLEQEGRKPLPAAGAAGQPRMEGCCGVLIRKADLQAEGLE